jgi:hypothetical protein
LRFVCDDARVESNRSREVRRSGAPYFLYVTIHRLKAVEAERYANRDPLLFVYGDARAENSRRTEVHRSGAPCFLYAVMRMLKIVEAGRYVNESLLLFFTR